MPSTGHRAWGKAKSHYKHIAVRWLELWLRCWWARRRTRASGTENVTENLGTMVLPNQKAIAKVNTLMEDGAITDEKTIKQLKNLGKETAGLAAKVK